MIYKCQNFAMKPLTARTILKWSYLWSVELWYITIKFFEIFICGILCRHIHFRHMSSKTTYVGIDDICRKSICRRKRHMSESTPYVGKAYVVENDICRFWRHMLFRHMSSKTTMSEATTYVGKRLCRQKRYMSFLTT